MARRIPFFTVFYSTTFTVLLIILIVLLLITPGDHVYQSYHKQRLYNIFIVAGSYLLTLLISAFMFAGRLYTTRTTLASVPRDWFYDEKGGGVPQKVRKLAREGVQRSVRVAWSTRPRDLQHEGNPEERPKQGREQGGGGEVPHWGIISHPGWSSPDSPDLPHLHLAPIILELPHLIEAKAVSLTPTLDIPQDSPGVSHEEQDLPVPSPLAVSLLQRPAATSLRDYLTHLSTLGLINPPSLLPIFLSAYESARFSAAEISEADFRTLMAIFAELLRGMQALDPELADEMRASEEAEITALEADGAVETEEGAEEPRSSLETTSTVAHTPMPAPYISSESGSIASSGHQSQQYRAHDQNASASASANTTASGTQHRGLRTPSIATLRSIRSRASSVLTGDGSVGAGSVIHFADAAGPLELPYKVESGGD
ncbi:MAG: hypothetical protein Q9191_007488 [Dirinaria sp. TL-2023a]